MSMRLDTRLPGAILPSGTSRASFGAARFLLSVVVLNMTGCAGRPCRTSRPVVNKNPPPAMTVAAASARQNRRCVCRENRTCRNGLRLWEESGSPLRAAPKDAKSGSAVAATSLSFAGADQKTILNNSPPRIIGGRVAKTAAKIRLLAGYPPEENHIQRIVKIRPSPAPGDVRPASTMYRAQDRPRSARMHRAELSRTAHGR